MEKLNGTIMLYDGDSRELIGNFSLVYDSFFQLGQVIQMPDNQNKYVIVDRLHIPNKGLHAERMNVIITLEVIEE
jgi:hypothetical protein